MFNVPRNGWRIAQKSRNGANLITLANAPRGGCGKNVKAARLTTKRTHAGMRANGIKMTCKTNKVHRNHDSSPLAPFPSHSLHETFAGFDINIPAIGIRAAVTSTFQTRYGQAMLPILASSALIGLLRIP